MRHLLVALGLCLLVGISTAAEKAPVGDEAGSAGPQVQAQPEPRIKRVGPGLFRVGTVVLDAPKRTVRCLGHVNMDREGPIELLACLPRGKTHESVFTLDVEPFDVQIALLLLGLKDGRNPAIRYSERNPDREKPPGDKVSLSVEWREKPPVKGTPAAVRRVRAEQFLFNVQTEEALEKAEWVFLGSRLVGDQFGADLDGTIVTTYHDPLSILELCLPTANDDIYYFVNDKLCPPVGTPIELIIQAPPRKQELDAGTANHGHQEMSVKDRQEKGDKGAPTLRRTNRCEHEARAEP